MAQWNMRGKLSFEKTAAYQVVLVPPIYDATSVDGWPSVHVSQQQWSFLANGAPQCLQTVDHYALGKTDSLCKNKLEGRYVALVGQEYDLENPQVVLYFFLQDILLSVDEGSRLGSELGMQDFGIEDFQISASASAEGWTPQQSRLHGNGWCAHKYAYLSRGLDVFLEVDLLSPTTVEGILIRNVKFDDSVDSTGLASFSVEYSGHENGNHYSSYGLDPLHEAPHSDTPSEVADEGLTVTANGVCISYSIFQEYSINGLDKKSTWREGDQPYLSSTFVFNILLSFLSICFGSKLESSPKDMIQMCCKCILL